jgi:hypothetical protein
LSRAHKRNLNILTNKDCEAVMASPSRFKSRSTKILATGFTSVSLTDSLFCFFYNVENLSKEEPFGLASKGMARYNSVGSN